MKNQKTVVLLGLLVILMSVFSIVSAQDPDLPAFKVSTVAPNEKIVLATRNFPADTAYTVSMASPEAPDDFTAVAKFNSKSGGSLNVTVKIPEKFQGLYEIELMLRDNNGGKILGHFVNDPSAAPIPEEPAAEEPVTEEPAAEEPEPIVLSNQEPEAEEPAADEPAAEEPIEDEPVAEEPAAEEPIEDEPAADEPAAEEPIEDEPAADEPAEEEPIEDEPAADEPAEEETAEEEPEPISLVNQEPAASEEEPEPIVLSNQEAADEEPAAEEPIIEKIAVEEPAAEEPAAEEQVIEEPAAETAEPAEIPVLVCNFAVIPSVTINAVQKDASVTFTTANFPADSEFSVSMGFYVQSWTPDPMPAPRPMPHHRGPAPRNDGPHGAPSFKPIDLDPEPGHHRPMPAPSGHFTSSFSGTEVGTFSTGTGEPQTLTFEIPESLKGASPIALWIQDLGPCGFYSYNYFYNSTVN